MRRVALHLRAHPQLLAAVVVGVAGGLAQPRPAQRHRTHHRRLERRRLAVPGADRPDDAACRRHEPQARRREACGGRRHRAGHRRRRLGGERSWRSRSSWSAAKAQGLAMVVAVPAAGQLDLARLLAADAGDLRAQLRQPLLPRPPSPAAWVSRATTRPSSPTTPTFCTSPSPSPWLPDLRRGHHEPVDAPAGRWRKACCRSSSTPRSWR